MNNLAKNRVLWLMLFALLVGGAVQAQEKGIVTVPREQVQEERAKRWAVLIGVDAYEDTLGIGSLKHCSRDMKLLYSVLTSPSGGFFPDNVLVMTADAERDVHRPTYSNMVTLLPLWLAAAGPQDDVLIAFSGHGVAQDGQAYLLPSTARSANIPLTAVPMRLVREWMDACRAERKILIVDACHSGAGKDAPAMSNEFLEDVGRGKGFITLASCGPRQKSNEDGELQSALGKGHGVFTYFLANGLQGSADRDADGRIDVGEAYRYAFDKTRRWAMRRGVSQEPVMSGYLRGQVTISYHDVQDKEIPKKEIPSEVKERLSRIQTERMKTQDITEAMNEGDQLRRADEWKKAEACYRKALIASGYKNDRARFEMARAGGKHLLTRRKYDDAEKAFREALAIPGHEQDRDTLFSFHLARGQRLLHDKDYEEAAQVFQDALEVPGYADDKMATLLRKIALEREKRITVPPIIQ